MPSSSPGSRLSGILYGFAAVGGALVLAVVDLFRDSIPRAVQVAFGRLGGLPLAALRSLQSGLATDYVAFVTVGVAVIGGLLTVLCRR